MLKILLIFVISCLFSSFSSFGFLYTVFGVLNFNCSFCFCFMCWGAGRAGKVNPSFLCWAIAQTKTMPTCEWDHLWNDGLRKKPTPIPTLVRANSSKLLILLNIWCGAHLPHVMPKLKRDENFARLIWAIKVYYARALEMFGITKIGEDLHPKGTWKRDHLICELPWIGDDSWLVSSIAFNFHFKFVLCFKHVVSKLYSLLCVYVHFRIQNTTKDTFIDNLVKIILAI